MSSGLVFGELIFTPRKLLSCVFRSFFSHLQEEEKEKVVVLKCSRLWLTGTEEQVISNFSHSQQCG